jgi:branched-chain amino acid transport system ATP-binding protein
VTDAVGSGGGTATAEMLVEARHLSCGYGEMAVVRDLELSVAAGEVVALIGPNGAGKTTTLLTLAGELRPLSGEVWWMGKPTTAPMHRRCNEGLSYVTEERSVIMKLTAQENLRLAGVSVETAVSLFPELEPLLGRRAGLLSGGEQQMLTLARALGRDPTMMLLDELSLGLAPMIVRRLLDAVRTAADDRGVGALLVEQHVRQALAVADRVYVMRRGRIVMSGPAGEIRGQLQHIEAAYLHTATDSDEVATTRKDGPGG